MYHNKIVRPHSRTKEGIFPIRSKGCFTAWLLQPVYVEKPDHSDPNGLLTKTVLDDYQPLAFELIGRRPSKASGTNGDSFEVGHYDLGGLWKILQFSGALMGGMATDFRIYGIGEQAKLPESERWKIEKTPCVAWGLELICANSSVRDNLTAFEWERVPRKSLNVVKWFPSEEARSSFQLPPGTVLADKLFQPSLYEKWLCTAPTLNEGEYVYANTPEKAREFFRQSLAKKQIPCPLEWEDALWDAFTQKGWLSQLEGHRMAGFKIINDREQTLDLIGDMIENSFGATPGSNPDLPILQKIW